MQVQDTATAVIAASGTTSGEINLDGVTLLGLHIPTGFTGTTLTFSIADKDDNYRTLSVDGSDYSLTVAANKYCPIKNPEYFVGVKKLKLVSGSTEGAERTIPLHTRLI